MGRHLLAGAPVDDQRLVRAQPAGDPGGVHRRVAAAVDRHAATDHRPLAGGDAAQERHRVHDPPRIPGRDVDPLGQVGPDRDEDRVEAALLPLGDEVLDPVLAGHPHAQRRDPVELAGEHVAGQPVGRDAVPHHPARLAARVPDLHLVAEPGQVVGGRQPARPGADHEHPLAAADRRRVEAATPAPARGRPGTARPNGSRRRCRGWRGCRRSRTGGSRPARGSRAADCPRRADATPARAGPPGCATARPGCSRRPGSRRCTAAAGRRRRAGALGPGRCGSARAAGRAAASRPASGRSCRSPRSDGHGPQVISTARPGSAGFLPVLPRPARRSPPVAVVDERMTTSSA